MRYLILFLLITSCSMFRVSDPKETEKIFSKFHTQIKTKKFKDALETLKSVSESKSLGTRLLYHNADGEVKELKQTQFKGVIKFIAYLDKCLLKDSQNKISDCVRKTIYKNKENMLNILGSYSDGENFDRSAKQATNKWVKYACGNKIYKDYFSGREVHWRYDYEEFAFFSGFTKKWTTAKKFKSGSLCKK